MENTMTLVDSLNSHARLQSSKIAFRYLDGELRQVNSRTYQDLYQRAKRIANELIGKFQKGERVLLVFPLGLEFIDAFLGCLYAGVIAVPVAPPSNKKTYWEKIDRIVKDCDVSGVITLQQYSEKVTTNVINKALTKRLHLFIVDKSSPCDEQKVGAIKSRSSEIAFLQYSSGSTGFPKAVAITHASMMHNQRLIQRNFATDINTVGCGWLPLHHDMGLIGNVLHTIYLGSSLILFSPITFVTKPLLWLQVISKYRVTVSGGPNFAYDLCVSKVTSDQLQTLDLSSWKVAFVGSEPVRSNVVNAFIDKFSQYGLNATAMHPCYGLAEACLFVSGCSAFEQVQAMTFDRQQLQHQSASIAPLTSVDEASSNSKIELISAGHLSNSSEIQIVNVDSKSTCAEGIIGEVWVAVKGIQNSYWGNPELTEYTFNAFDDRGNGPFLRTGDLGFIYNSQLFIVARLKDLIIIRGRNHAPQDIEQTVQNCDSGLKRDAGVAFSFEGKEGEECLVIVQEVCRSSLRTSDFEKVIDNIRRSILQNHEINPLDIILIKPSSLPKTTSGKVRRNATKSLYAAGELSVIKRLDTQQKERFSANATERAHSHWEKILLSLWSDVLNKPIDQIDVFDSFFDLGGDSLTAQQIIGYLHNHYQIEIDGSEVYHALTIRALAEIIEQKKRQSGFAMQEEVVSGEI